MLAGEDAKSKSAAIPQILAPRSLGPAETTVLASRTCSYMMHLPSRPAPWDDRPMAAHRTSSDIIPVLTRLLSSA